MYRVVVVFVDSRLVVSDVVQHIGKQHSNLCVSLGMTLSIVFESVTKHARRANERARARKALTCVGNWNSHMRSRVCGFAVSRSERMYMFDSIPAGLNGLCTHPNVSCAAVCCE